MEKVTFFNNLKKTRMANGDGYGDGYGYGSGDGVNDIKE